MVSIILFRSFLIFPYPHHGCHEMNLNLETYLEGELGREWLTAKLRNFHQQIHIPLKAFLLRAIHHLLRAIHHSPAIQVAFHLGKIL